MAGFVYIYRTAAGERREAEIDAASRDAAFAELRGRGIRPIKVVAKDGTKENGASGGRLAAKNARGAKIVGVGVVVVTAAALSFALSAFFAAKEKAPTFEASTERAAAAQPLVRQAIPGDRKRIESAVKSLFDDPVEALLARFAEPGRPYALPAQLPTDADARTALAHTLRIARAELSEEIDLKRIVTWMKREMRTYLAAGHTLEDYAAELVKRQETEIAHRKSAEKRLAELVGDGDEEKAYNFWLKANAQLQSMGIYPIPLPDALREYQMRVDWEG